MRDHRIFDRDLSLHDWLSLGEVARVAEGFVTYTDAMEQSKEQNVLQVRYLLPFLLRLLESTRDCASDPPMKNSDVVHGGYESKLDNDFFVDNWVHRLEEIAVIYRISDDIKTLVAYIVPLICRSWNKLSPLSKHEWGVKQKQLQNIFKASIGCRGWTGEGKSRFAKGETKQKNNYNLSYDDNIDAEADNNKAGNDGMDVDDKLYDNFHEASTATSSEKGELPTESSSKKGTHHAKKELTMESLFEIFNDEIDDDDTAEARVIKLFQEITILVLVSLEKTCLLTKDRFTANKSEKQTKISPEVNSLLFDHNSTKTISKQRDKKGYPPCFSSFGADIFDAIAALMHHAIVLRHRHLASALCRVEIPVARTRNAIVRLAKNCPSVSACLLRGCIDAYRVSNIRVLENKVDGILGHEDGDDNDNESYHNAAASAPSTKTKTEAKSLHCSRNVNTANLIPTVTTAAVLGLAKLSNCENRRVITTLHQSSREGMPHMLDLLLELSIPDDPDAVATLIIQHLSSPIILTNAENTSASIKNYRRQMKRKAKHAGQPCASQQEKSHANRYRATLDNDKTTGSVHRRFCCKSLRRRRFMKSSCASFRMTSLHQHLKNKPELTHSTYKCLIEEMKLLMQSNVGLLWGRLALFLRAYCWLMLRLGLTISDENDFSVKEMLEQFVSNILLVIDKLSHSRMKDRTKELPTNCKMDKCFQLMICSCLLTCARLSSLKQAYHNNTFQTCILCLERILQVRTLSTNSNMYAFRVISLMQQSSVSLLANNVISTMTGMNASQLECNHFKVDDDIMKCLEEVCNGDFNLLRKNESTSLLDLSNIALLEDIMSLLQFIKSGDISESRLNKILLEMLGDDAICSKLFHKEGICSLVQVSVDIVSDKTGPVVPLISPLQLKSVCEKIQWSNLLETGKFDQICYQFLLQLLYCLLFFDKMPESPFAIKDLRSLPLKETLLVYKQMLSGSNYNRSLQSFGTTMNRLLHKYCPEVLLHARIQLGSLSSVQIINTNVLKSELLTQLSSAIRKCKEEEYNYQARKVAERLFISSQLRLPSADVDTIAAGALLAERNSPLPFLTYERLLRDPVVLLKCSVSIWKYKELRKIVLSILCRLLRANEFIIKEVSPSKEVANELIASRNAVVARCLLVAVSGGSLLNGEAPRDELRPFFCSTMLSFVRLLVVRQNALVIMLIKQGIPTNAVDFLAEFVPEAMNDGQALSTMLSERSSLTAAQRLTSADAAFQIAVAHGSRDEKESQKIAYNALCVMVNSFSLVLGPVGVPINALCEDSELDVTQVSRKAMFRMLSTLQKVDVRRFGMRNECCIALQKVAGLCKSEGVMSGVSGIEVARRKNLIKDIWNEVLQAANRLGAAQI